MRCFYAAKLQPSVTLYQFIFLASGYRYVHPIIHYHIHIITPEKLLYMVQVNDELAVYPQEMLLLQYILHIFQCFRNDVLLFIKQKQFSIIITGFGKNNIIDFNKRWMILNGKEILVGHTDTMLYPELNHYII